jgi:hypothetical protein
MSSGEIVAMLQFSLSGGPRGRSIAARPVIASARSYPL